MGGWQGGIPLYLAALGRILAQFSPAAPRFRLRRATLPPSATHLLAAARLGAVVGGGATTVAMAVCTAIPVPQGCSGRCRDRRDRS